ncbi:family 78 glycoside hydrolase catalytic domain [Jiangella alkaliphila]|uniref:alpha-L-rhamnosidase n=1 Tax=Jiangella alkaliphila TaxID=419479 RepID=A0A1H2K3J5_9ACTN|nr:family 78 glycoside hydrolase catalytic domain [Jiangella alkaliphila]SDU63277.1 alpha-L-rhamnosidase [Jiangella alkaliphila]
MNGSETTAAESGSGSVRVENVRFEHLDRSLGCGVSMPRLSWQISTDDPEWQQKAYEVRLDGGRTVHRPSEDQVLVDWPFEPLESRTRARVEVRVSAGASWSAWSQPATVEIGLLSSEDWSARFIRPSTIGTVDRPAPILSRRLVAGPGVAAGRLYVTAHGVYRARLNGHEVGDDVLAPGWSSYGHRLCYQTYDVTRLLRDGDNVLEVLLGNGWYRGRFLDQTMPSRGYGDGLALLAQLEVTYASGAVDVIATDRRWSARESGVLENDLYDGQYTDLRRLDRAEDTVDELEETLDRLVAPDGPPVRPTGVRPAVDVWTSPSGRTLVDFGQNLVGWVRLRVNGPVAGQRVVVRHAEVLEDGELCTRTLRSARATDTYVLDDADDVVLEPALTFHGFRYAEISGLEPLRAADVEAVVVGTDLRRTGWFSCSDPDLERLHENVVWSARGNFLSIPSDCPQRDERLGWTGDLQVFAPTATFLFDSGGFLTSWLADLAADQHADGTVPVVVPNVLPDDSPAVAAWSDAATIVPWVLYQAYGDKGLLARQFESMKRWVDKVVTLAPDGLWVGGFQFGDWLDPTPSARKAGEARADPDVIATAYLVHSAQIVAQTARVLGDLAVADEYQELATRTREAFVREYVTPAGRIVSDAPTAYALALEFGLLPAEEQRRRAGARLADLVRAGGFRVATGFLGTPLVTAALTSAGQVDLAYRLLLERGCPSWLHTVEMGATTIWERWDSMRSDGSVNVSEMTSFNHYAYGAVADWLHRSVAGLAPAAPGYREVTVRPELHQRLTSASARLLTPYGETSAGWERRDGRVRIDVVIPPGSRATVHLPDGQTLSVDHGRHTFTTADPCARTLTGQLRSVRDLLDSSLLWGRVTSTLVDAGVASDAAEVAAWCAPYLDAPVDGLPGYLSRRNDVAPDVRQALRELVEEHASQPGSR